jgi:phosphoribosylamine-glycine ligase
MVGSALKKMAKENGMQVAHGVAYGAYRGFALTMKEGSGWKALEFATRFVDPAGQDALERKLNEVDLKRT